jgi:hypothetical protein
MMAGGKNEAHDATDKGREVRRRERRGERGNSRDSESATQDG